MMNTRRWLGALLVTSLGLTACDLDLNDPNFPPEDEVFSEPTGLMAIGVGLQAEFSDFIASPVYVTGLVVDEIGAGSATFLNFQNADIGAELDPATDMSTGPWTQGFRVIKLTNDLLRSVPTAALQPGTRSGLLALAKLYKAMTYGWLIQLYEQVPLDAGIDNPQPSFNTRQEVLTEVLRLLNEARADITTTAPTTEFNNTVLAPGFNLLNSIDAMLARYGMIAGNYTAANEAAQRVTATSELRFSTTDRNSVHVLMYLSGNAWQMRPEQRLRLEAESGDRRVSYWVVAADVAGAHARLDELNKYRATDVPFPLYLPDEMKLIRAEAFARTGDLAQARTLINEVRTQCPSGTAEPAEPMACLPALTASDLADAQAVLDEILRQRRYELFLQGLRYEDLRRFGGPLKYNWIPYPTAECSRNENAPC